jgi:hypothetical protein
MLSANLQTSRFVIAPSQIGSLKAAAIAFWRELAEGF